MKYKPLLISLALAAGFAACDDSTTVGTSLVDDDVTVVIDSCFTVTGQTIETTGVQSRTLSQMIGDVTIDGFGRMRSSVVAQFMPASLLDTAGIYESDIDSLKLVLSITKGEYIGDSIAPMGMKVYPLTKELPSPIYSDFDPTGYYDANTVLGSRIYNTTALTQSDTLQAMAITVKLPTSLGREIFTKYKTHPEYFLTPTAFSENVFKGVYIDNSYGSGRITRIYDTSIRMFYHKTYYDEDAGKDTTVYGAGDYFAITPEVVSNNNFDVRLANSLKEMVKKGDNLIVAPVGYDVELTFPGRELVASYNTNSSKLKVVNSLTFQIPIDTIANNAGLTPPPYLLMVKKSKRNSFFTDNELTDDVNSFYAAYDSSTKSYTFSSMRSYMLDLLDKSEITDDDVTFVLCPVTVNTESTTSYYTTTTSVTSIVPYITSPAMVKILLDQAKIKFAYSTQSKIF
jgi:hypothetical protein